MGVAQTPVGLLANGPEGSPVVAAHAPPDPEIAGVADHRLGAQRPVFLEVRLDPAGPVVADKLRVDALGDDLGPKPPRGLPAGAAVEDQRDLGGRPMSRWSPITPSKNARPEAGGSNTRVSETSNWRTASS